MRPVRDLDLMRLADGELDADERAELEAAVAADPAAARKVEAVGHLGDAVRGHLELSADAADARLARMWDEVEKRLDLDAAPARDLPVRSRPGLWQRFTAWLDAHRGHVLTGAVSAAAVAAIALILRPDPEVVKVREPVTVPTPTVKTPSTTNDPDSDMMPVVHQPAQVESMEVAGGTGTVFTIEDDDGEETTVIWVTPDDTVEGI
jgi:anti-sigma-K factor RskA